jgi:hypothetical protein
MPSDPPPAVAGRDHQRFPVLTDTEIARVSRFGTVRRYKRGERLFGVGEPGPGMYVVLRGIVTLTQRDRTERGVPFVSVGRVGLPARSHNFPEAARWSTPTPGRKWRRSLFRLPSCAR